MEGRLFLVRESAAPKWFQWMTRNGLITTWARFEENVKNRFGPSKYGDLKGALSKLLQLGTVEDYQQEFEKLMNRVTDMSDSLLISFYIYGLKLHLQREILVSRPTTMGDAFSLPLITEAHFGDQAASVAGEDDQSFAEEESCLSDEFIITEGQILGKTSMVYMDDFCIDEDQHGFHNFTIVVHLFCIRGVLYQMECKSSNFSCVSWNVMQIGSFMECLTIIVLMERYANWKFPQAWASGSSLGHLVAISTLLPSQMHLKVMIRNMLPTNQASRETDFANDEEVIARWGSILYTLHGSPILLVLDVWFPSIIMNFRVKCRGYKILVTSRTNFPKLNTCTLLPLAVQDAINLPSYSALSEHIRQVE
nr:NB-ARC domains-containing protein [Tanacetum cinerariifolium]